MPKNVFFTRASKLEFSVNLQGWGATGEASSVLRAILVTYDRDAGMGIYNIGRYSNLEVDSLVEKALVEVNDEKREDLLKKATEIAMADYALYPPSTSRWERGQPRRASSTRLGPMNKP